jgi:serine phosphatase RsbU (regulator of sigma subunit)
MTALARADEYDRELESDRARWLRRRFLAYCALWAIFASGMALLSLLVFDEEGRNTPLMAWDLGTTLFSVAIAAAAGVYAWRAPVRLPVLFRLTYVLAVIGFAVTAAFWRGHVLLDGDPDTTLRDTARGLPVTLLVRHLLPCLLIPWTLRESLRPATVLVALVAALLGYDVARGSVPAGPAAEYFVVACLAALPGAAVCWWRYSRYQRDFLFRFESSLYRRLQGELASARRVHESCLPPPIADGPVRLSYAYEPMRQIGGDLLFVHPPPAHERRDRGADSDGQSHDPVPHGPVSVVVLDVTGHGIAAALTVNRLVGELERIFSEDPAASPGRVLSGLNRYVTLTLARYELFATALCLRLDPLRHTVEWASGGHPPAYLRRAGDTDRVEPLESTAPMLGVVEPADYDAAPQQLPLAPGDVLLAYTDGASEAADRAARQLGTTGVMRLFTSVSSDGLAPEACPAALLQRIAAYRGGAPDDDTLIVALACAESLPSTNPARTRAPGLGPHERARL